MVLQELVCKINVFVFSTIQRVKQTVCQAISIMVKHCLFSLSRKQIMDDL